MNQVAFHLAKGAPQNSKYFNGLMKEYSMCKFVKWDLYSFNLVLIFFYYIMTNIPRKILKLSAIIYYNKHLTILEKSMKITVPTQSL